MLFRPLCFHMIWLFCPTNLTNLLSFYIWTNLDLICHLKSSVASASDTPRRGLSNARSLLFLTWVREKAELGISSGPLDGYGHEKMSRCRVNLYHGQTKPGIYSGRLAALQTSKPCLIRHYRGRIPTTTEVCASDCDYLSSPLDNWFATGSTLITSPACNSSSPRRIIGANKAMS